MSRIEEHKAVQAAAKKVLVQLETTLTPKDSEQSIARRAVSMLASLGITETWYHNCPALVLAGTRTCLSQSGRDYCPVDEEIGPTNLVTVDLSPSVKGVWGDCARSFFVEHGTSVRKPKNSEFIRGQEVLGMLHISLLTHATPETKFCEVCDEATSQMRMLGFVNLDFLGNVGHTIESDPAQRSFLEKGNNRKLSSTPLFTFEPHIKALEGNWGFKHEDIYYFQEGKLQSL